MAIPFSGAIKQVENQLLEYKFINGQKPDMCEYCNSFKELCNA